MTNDSLQKCEWQRKRLVSLSIPLITCFCMASSSIEDSFVSTNSQSPSLDGTAEYPKSMEAVPLRSLLNCEDTEPIDSWSPDVRGTSSGGTYLRIRTETATVVKARRVPTLTCTHIENGEASTDKQVILTQKSVYHSNYYLTYHRSQLWDIHEEC